MKKNKLIKILASATAIGTIGTGVIVSISACGPNSGNTSEKIHIVQSISTINAEVGIPFVALGKFSVYDSHNVQVDNAIIDIETTTLSSKDVIAYYSDANKSYVINVPAETPCDGTFRMFAIAMIHGLILGAFSEPINLTVTSN